MMKDTVPCPVPPLTPRVDIFVIPRPLPTLSSPKLRKRCFLSSPLPLWSHRLGAALSQAPYPCNPEPPSLDPPLTLASPSLSSLLSGGG